MKTLTQDLSNLLNFKYNPTNDIAVFKNIAFHIIPLKLNNQTYWDNIFNIRYKNRCIFFEDEWVNKRNIVLSMISHQLNASNKRIYARKCEVKKITPKVANIFFNLNHISGGTQASMAFGLFYNDELISCISFRKPFIAKYKDFVEIARFASLINHSVVGAFSKLLHFSKPYLEEKNIITYADKRFGYGKVYQKNSFKLIGSTPQDYYYTDGKVRYNRFKFRAQDGKTEKEIALINSVFRVYGCGSLIYTLGGNS